MAILLRVRRCLPAKWLYEAESWDGVRFRTLLGVNPAQQWAAPWALHIADKMIECERRYLLIRART